ncbi:alpha-amylase family glycosyl hydrolase [Alteromonas antoniana]|uniref:alpha-amylase family glycosyl hydrolase n=1 Tax=Alteromonas antoniana TaxID=2803813 RepID=UPI001C48CFAD
MNIIYQHFKLSTLLLVALLVGSGKSFAAADIHWKSATVYFILLDRFKNGDNSNDYAYGRPETPAKLRGFVGGDIRGVIQQLKSGYFSNLGVDTLWLTPVFEQIHGVDTSSGATYAYHGYWPKDFTQIDANFGTKDDFKELVTLAHSEGIRILFDVIINHTGPQTAIDEAWPASWVRTRPLCNWSSYIQNTGCALATSLTDMRTDSSLEVTLPDWLKEKWREEGRLDQELAELDNYFARTQHPRLPKYYLIKWLSDWVREFGLDGFRVDTAKHVEPEVWTELKVEADLALKEWRSKNPNRITPDIPFYMVGEVMHWGLKGFKNAIEGTGEYDFGDKKVNYFDFSFDGLINMGFPEHLKLSAAQLFSDYSHAMNSAPMQSFATLNYISSHDDPESFDRERKFPYQTAFKLMMAPGAAQIYYGDELARPLLAPDAVGDASLRVPMNWADLALPATQQLLLHWQKLGQFRNQYRAIGAGQHTVICDAPYTFARELKGHPSVIIAASLPNGKKNIPVGDYFADGSLLRDHYSGQSVQVIDGSVTLDNMFSYALLAESTTH